MSFRCYSGGRSRLERNELTCLCALGANWTSSSFFSFSLSLFSPPSCILSGPVLCGLAGLVGLTLGSASQMLPWGKQKHLSSAQPWLSLSDKSWGGLCQRCPACHLSPSYTISPTQPLHIHTHFTLFALVRLHPDSVTEAGGSLPFCPLAFYALVLGWHIYAGSEKGCRL